MSSFFDDKEDNDGNNDIGIDANDIAPRASYESEADREPDIGMDQENSSPKDWDFDDDDTVVEESFENRLQRAQLVEGRSASVKPDSTLHLQEVDIAKPEQPTPLKRIPKIRNWIIAGFVGALAIGGIAYAGHTYTTEDQTAKGNPGINSSQQEITNGVAANSSSGEEDNTDDSSTITVPRGGSLVKYEVEAEGDISSVAISYLDAEGNQAEEENASVPWTKSVGMEENQVGAVAVATSGDGTVSCSVYKDDELVESDSDTGDSPTLQCTGD